MPGTVKHLCGPHYYRQKRYGDPLGFPPPRATACSIEGCGKKVLARGWCSRHWTAWQRYGDPVRRSPGEVVDGCRICPKCGEDKLRTPDHWHRNSRQPGGLAIECKQCVRARRIRYLADNAERINQRRREIYDESAEAERERARLWRRANPSRARMVAAAGHNKRRARKLGRVVEQFSVEEIFERDHWTCGICDQPIDPAARYPDPMMASLDHVIPISRGGSHTRSNTQASHLRCNMRKHAALPGERLDLTG